MPSNLRYSTMYQSQQQSQPNLYNYQQQQQSQQQQQQQQQHHHHHHHHHHRSHHSSPTLQIPNNSSRRLTITNNNNSNNNNNQTNLSTNQSSAYFLDRVDLENYTTQILKQTVETILSKTKSKGLKVKIALPDDGLIIHNITDPSQSWIYKTSELLYFWRDPYYLNIIIVITINRSRRQSNRPYSASIFRLRGTDSAQLFLQQARQFFSNLSTVSNTATEKKFNRNKSVESLNRISNSSNDSNISTNQKTKTKSISSVNGRSAPSSSSSSSATPKATPEHNHHHHHHHYNHQSSQVIPTTPVATPAIRRVTRAEFDPGKATITDNTSNHRTYSETASSTDSHTVNSIKELISQTKKSDDDDDDDDKLTIMSNNLSNEQVAELVRELKELRIEIASLKLSSNTPLPNQSESSKQTNDSSVRTSSPTSQSEIDAGTQTDFSLINQQRRRTALKKNKKTMIGTGGVLSIHRRKTSLTRNGRRTISNSSTNTVSEPEETTSEISSQVNDSVNDTNITRIQEQQPVVLPAPPRPILLKNQNNFNPSTSYTISHGNQIISNEEGTLASSINGSNEKETSKFLSTNNSSSNLDTIGSKITAGVSNFRSSVENSNIPQEPIYENVPILIQANSNRDAYYNIPIINADDSQQQNPISNQTNSNSPPTNDTNTSEGQLITGDLQQQQKPQIVSAGRHRNQPIYFANHLTNPIFNVDKQLLINTVANQFGVELNSPQLQQLITNQHLFVARKRTFANMVWQLTPDEETALCSPPTATQTTTFDIDTLDSNNSSARSILKAKKRLHSSSKRRGISWDSALE